MCLVVVWQIPWFKRKTKQQQKYGYLSTAAFPATGSVGLHLFNYLPLVYQTPYKALWGMLRWSRYSWGISQFTMRDKICTQRMRLQSGHEIHSWIEFSEHGLSLGRRGQITWCARLGACRCRNWISREQREENERLCVSFVLGKWERKRRKMQEKTGVSWRTPTIST